MKTTFKLLRILFFSLALLSCTSTDHIDVASPDGNFRFELRVENSLPSYRAYFKNKEIIGKSTLGFDFSGQENSLNELTIKDAKVTKVETHWKPVYGEKNQYPEHYQQAIVSFSSSDRENSIFQLNIRVYNEGIAFRYEFQNAKQTTINAELTEFALPTNSELWVSRRAQSEITKQKISELDDSSFERPLLAQ